MIESFKSLKWVDSLFFTLTEPRALARQIESQSSYYFYFSFMIPVFLAFTDSIIISKGGSLHTNFFYYQISYGSIILSSWLVFKIIVGSSLIDLVAQLDGGGKGNLKSILTLINFSMFPLLLLLPIISIFDSVGGGAANFVSIFASIILTIWGATIAVRGLSEILTVSVAKALLYYLFPLLLLVTLMLIVVVSGYFLATGIFLIN